MKSSRALVSSAHLAALICFATTTPAQKSAPPDAKPDYSRESSIVEHYDRVYRFAADGTGSREITGVVDVRDQASVKAWSVLNFTFASSAEHVVIDYVRVRRADGTILPTPAADAQELPAAVTREAPFYSDLKEEQIPVRSLREGDHLEYKFHIVRTKPEAPNHFWGEENFYTPVSATVVLSETVELHLPKDAYINTWSPKLKPTTTDTPTERIYRWQSAQLEPVAGKDHKALLRMGKDPALLDETEPHLPVIAWTTFHTWAEVGAWYRSMEGTRTDPDDDIRARVKELTAGKSTEDEKARASGLKLRLQNQRTYTVQRGKLTPKGQGWATIEMDVTTKGTAAVRFVQGDKTLEPLFESVRQLDLNLSIPPASQASLLRRGILSCSTPTCQLVLVSPQDALR